MTPTLILALAGIAASLTGTLVLATSLNSLLDTLSWAIDAHDTTIQMLTDPTSDVAVFTGIDSHLRLSERTAKRRTIAGILVVGLGCVLQALAVILSLL